MNKANYSNVDILFNATLKAETPANNNYKHSKQDVLSFFEIQ